MPSNPEEYNFRTISADDWQKAIADGREQAEAALFVWKPFTHICIIAKDHNSVLEFITIARIPNEKAREIRSYEALFGFSLGTTIIFTLPNWTDRHSVLNVTEIDKRLQALRNMGAKHVHVTQEQIDALKRKKNSPAK